MLYLLILLIVLLAVSAFFSGSETALFALGRLEIKAFRRSRNPAERLVGQLLEHPRKLLLTLMIGNVTVNVFVLAASLALCRHVASNRPLVATALGLIAPVVLTLMGDVLPKGTAILLGRRFAVRAAPVIRFFQFVLTPFNMLFGAIVGPVTRLLVGGRQPDDYVTVHELQQLIEMSERHRIIDADENAMLSEVIQLGRLRVKDVMVPRVDMVAFEIHDDPDELRRLMREQGFAKLPIYDSAIDKVLGVIYAKDLFLHPTRPLATMVRPVHFVPEIITLTQLLTHFRSRRSQLAIAVDEYGGVVGVVTVEDVAEQIVGELAAPGEEVELSRWRKLDDRRYHVSGSINIREWAEQFHVRHLDERVTTLGGLVMARLGRPPVEGDSVQVGNLRLTVHSLEGRRIDWILLELLDGHSSRPSPSGGGGRAT